MVARRPSGGGLEVRTGRSDPPSQAGGGRGRGRLCERTVSTRAAEGLAEGVGGRLRVQRRRHDRRLRHRDRAPQLSQLRDHRRQRRIARSDQRDRARASARPRHRHSQPRPERRPQRRPVGLERRDCRLHRRRYARRSRLAHVSGAAVPHLRRRRLGRAERRAGRRSADRAVHRPRARRADARAAQRSNRRARARLQHGLPPRRPAGDRRLQPDLPPRRRRCGRVLAAAGAGLEDRLRLGGTGVAPPPRLGQGLLAPAGRLRRGRDLADGPSSRQVSRRPHALARTHLQSAAVRALAVGGAHQRRRLGHGGVSVGVPHRRASVRVPAALDPLSGDLERAHARRSRRGEHPLAPLGGGHAARERHRRHRCDHRQEHRLRDALRSRFAQRQRALVPDGRRLSPLHPADRADARADSRRALAARGGAAASRAAAEPAADAVAR